VTPFDLDNKQHISDFVEAFYGKILADPSLAPIFLDVAEIELDKHLPLIRSYWEKLLLGDTDYNRHTMNIHRALNSKRTLHAEDFDRWLALFCLTADESYVGPRTERAKQVATTIAINMQRSLSEP
jgi:hemoglobin